MSFAEDARSGVTLLTIQGTHTLDFAAAVLGPFVDLTGLTTQYPLVTVGNSETGQSRTIPDHVLAQVRFGAGAAFAVEVAGGQPHESTTFRIEIDGERSGIRIDGGAARASSQAN